MFENLIGARLLSMDEEQFVVKTEQGEIKHYLFNQDSGD